MSIVDFPKTELPVPERALAIIEAWASEYERTTGKSAPIFRRYSRDYYGAPGAFPRKYTLKDLEAMTVRLRRRAAAIEGNALRRERIRAG